MNIQQIIRDRRGLVRGNGGVCACPVCQPEARQGQAALSLNLVGDVLLAYCFKSGCDFRDIVSALGLSPRDFNADPAAIAAARSEREAEAAKMQAERQRRCDKIWRECIPIQGTPGESYLRGRGITCDLPPSLRWASQLYHGPSGSGASAMVARVSTGAIHRTFFDQQGNRLSADAKMLLGSTRGGAVRLSQATGPLVVCEGIETGLSLLSDLLSQRATVVAALSASGMAGLDLPQKPREIIIATDGDNAGRNAGRQLGERAAEAGWLVSTLDAPDGQDFNDILTGKAEA